MLADPESSGAVGLGIAVFAMPKLYYENIRSVNEELRTLPLNQFQKHAARAGRMHKHIPMPSGSSPRFV